MKSAVIFDMDGVIIDSEHFFIERSIAFAKSQKIELSYEKACSTIGLCYDDYIEAMAKLLNMEKEQFFSKFEQFKNEYKLNYKEMINEDAIVLLNWFLSKKIPVALASSSYTESLHTKLEQIGLQDSFDLILAGDMLAHPKPNPEIYLKSSETLHLKPSDCIAIEDSTVGIQAAHEAGLFVIARKNAHYDVDQSLADIIVDDLTKVIEFFEEIR